MCGTLATWSFGRSLSLPKGRPHPIIPGPPCSHSGLDPESPEPPVAKKASCALHRNICPLARRGMLQPGTYNADSATPTSGKPLIWVCLHAPCQPCPGHASSRDKKYPSLLTKPSISPSREQNRPRLLRNLAISLRPQ